MNSQVLEDDIPDQLGKADVRFLLFLKVAVGILIVFILVWGEDEAYPLTRWPMFSEAGYGPPPTHSTQVQVRIIDRSGTARSLPPLYTLPFGAIHNRVVGRAFNTQNPAEQDQYRAYLLERIRARRPSLELAQIQYRELRWEVQPYAVPPLDRDHPQITRTENFSTTYYTDLTSPPEALDHDPDLRFGDLLTLVAFELPSGVEARQCEPLYIRSWWFVTSAPDKNYHITMTLADSAGMGAAHSDAPLVGSETPQSRTGDELLDRRVIDIPCDIAPGDYSLLVGIYDPETVQNVSITYLDGNPYEGNLFYLTTINVKEERSW